MIGTYELPDRNICFETGLSQEELKAAKKELIRKVTFYQGWIEIKNSTKYQVYAGSKNDTAKQRELDLIPEDIKKSFESGVVQDKLFEQEPEKLEKSKEIDVFIDKFNECFGKSYKVTNGRTIKLKVRLKVYKMDQILKAVENLSRSPWHVGVNDRGWQANPDFLIRNDEQIDKWLNYKPTQAKQMANLNRRIKGGNKQGVDARSIQ